jgi:hypothetical protein
MDENDQVTYQYDPGKYHFYASLLGSNYYADSFGLTATLVCIISGLYMGKYMQTPIYAS